MPKRWSALVRFQHPAVVCAAALLPLSGTWTIAGEPRIYAGMTALELKAFAERQNWEADADPRSTNVVIEAEGQRIDITLLKCDANGLCRSGVIRHKTYHSINSRECNLWHWNLESRGATGYGPDYVTLQRYFHLRGTTDQYLRDVFDDWLKAAPDFWKLVGSCHEEQSKSRSP